MRKVLLLLLLLTSGFVSNSQIIYTNYYGAAYPYNIDSEFFFDLNNDGEDDVSLLSKNWATTSQTCGNSGGNPNQTKFKGGIGHNPAAHCVNIGIGMHMIGIRLITPNPSNNAMGFKYGYIVYELTSTSDVIIYGWYYEDSFNTPITANGLTVGLSEQENKSELVYPNPAENFINISSGKEYKIIDTMGKIVDVGISEGKIDVSNLQGFYYIYIDNNPHKVIIQ